MPRVLVIDDHDAMREGMAVTLKKDGHEVAAVKGGADGVAAYRKAPFDVVVTDLKMEPMSGLQVVEHLREQDPQAVVLVVTAFGSIEVAVEAMQKGAADFLTKPFSPEVLKAKVAKALELAATHRQLSRLSAHNEALTQDAARAAGNLVGDSAPMQKLVALVRRAAPTDATVLVTGESGTGKELVARMIHDLSPRAAKPFVVVHCAALAESLLESELFGHEKGAFTGAVKRKLGRFELADQGTLFLDEIGEISPAIQTKLLRVLQEKELQRVGGEETLKVDVRLVFATNRDLKAEVEKGRFREDLYYRLHIVPVHIPPLRERPEDVPALAAHFLQKAVPKIGRKMKGITPEALAVLQRYPWPGNVRELENVVEQSMVFADGDELGVTDLPAAFQKPLAPSTSLPALHGDRPLPEILEDLERALIERAYEKAGRVKTETARLLGIKTSALYYKLEKYGFIQKGEGPGEDG